MWTIIIAGRWTGVHPGCLPYIWEKKCEEYKARLEKMYWGDILSAMLLKLESDMQDLRPVVEALAREQE